MKKFYWLSVLFLFLKYTCAGQSYGLYFNSHEEVLEKRTSLDLSPEDSMEFNSSFNLKFDLNFLPRHSTYFGYITRIINSAGDNIDLIYNQKINRFEIIAGKSLSGISFAIDSLKLYNGWSKFNLAFDLESKQLSVSVNGALMGNCGLLVTSHYYKILFGANDFQKFTTRDVPPMQIKDVEVFENKKMKFWWPLNEDSGALCHDKMAKRIAKIKNPVWVKPKHQQWRLISSFELGGNVSVAHDTKNDNLYFCGSDSTAIISFKDEGLIFDWRRLTHHENLLLGSYGVFDTITGHVYNFFTDQKKVAYFNSTTNEWNNNFIFYGATEFLHANKFISPLDSCLYIIGGYGQLHYKNKVQRCNLNTGKWDTLVVSGDYYNPRYLAALGTNKDGSVAYLVGGYGSTNGDQLLSPATYYDLVSFNIKTRAFKKVCSFKTGNLPFTFANSLVAGPHNAELLGLVFSNDSYTSSLQLIAISPNDSSIHALGSPLPYDFHDIESYADLYYSAGTNRLLAVTLHFSKEATKEKITQIKIYSLDFPPGFENANETLSSGTARSFKNGFLLVICILSACIIFLIVLAYNKKNKKRLVKKVDFDPPVQPVEIQMEDSILKETDTVSEPSDRSAIYLFGAFKVVNAEGKDITSLFTPLLKELFLIILIHTLEGRGGISSEKLNDLLWYNKSAKDAKNNRSVNIAKLRAILNQVGKSSIDKSSGCWKIDLLDTDTYTDYDKYLSLTKKMVVSKEDMLCLLKISERGTFLSQTEYDWLDELKSKISNQIIDICLNFIKTQDITKDPGLIVQVSQNIFNFDQLNEEALSYKCKALIFLKRHTSAKTTYTNFAKYYKDVYGEEFARSFQDIVS